MGVMMVLVTIMIIALEFLNSDESLEPSAVGLLLIAWAGLGWYVGHKFNPSDSPKLAYLAFTVVTYLLAINLIGLIFASIFNKNTIADNEEGTE